MMKNSGSLDVLVNQTERQIMEELYPTNNMADATTGQRKFLGIPESVVDLITVFLFYVMLFITISFISRTDRSMNRPELTHPPNKTINHPH